MNTNKKYRSGTSFMMLILLAISFIFASSISVSAQAEKCHPPVADFSAEPTEGCYPFVVNFTDLSTGDISTWLWDFGDGHTSTEINPHHTYDFSGVYNVTLSLTGPYGSDSKTEISYITILDVPTVDFSYEVTSDCSGAKVDFQNLSGNATSWLWDFGDGNTSTDENPPTHSYFNSGIYTVTLIATNICGSVSESSEISVISIPDPVADFHADQTEVCVESDVTFYNDSQNAIEWHWDFGDGQTSYEQNPVHTYTIAGVYTVTLTVRNDCGEDFKIKEMYIRVIPNPIADFTSNSIVTCPGEAVSFIDQSTFANTWHWDFGDGTTSNEQSPTHIYTNSGQYAVILYVTNDCGQDTEIRENYITVFTDPVADYGYERLDECHPNVLWFYDVSSNATSWHWDFGDGNTSIEQNPQYFYVSNGSYTVTLTARNVCGEDNISKIVTVNIPPQPEADFSFETTPTCDGGVAVFADNSTDATSWLWDFGDGATSTDQNPTHYYLYFPGSHNVTLTAINSCGENLITKTVTTSSYPYANPEFTADKTSACTDETITFTDQSTNAVSWHWDFGDGNTSTDRNPSHAYSTAGTYDVSLHVYDRCGRDFTETKTQYITTEYKPIADFMPMSGGLCMEDYFNFSDYSSYATSWHWDFGDGSSSTAQNPQHTYNTDGIYTVVLTVTNSCGQDTKTIDISVNKSPQPVADFSYETVQYCYISQVTFTDLSSNAISWRWDFGDGSTSTEQNPIYNYPNAGTYTVTLIADNECGQNKISKTVVITEHSYPMADFSSDKTDACVDETVTFTDLSNNAVSWYWDFGDGNTSTVQNPTHTYASEGVYSVSLEIYDVCSRGDYEIKEQYIHIQAEPIANFRPESYHVCTANEIHFVDLSTGATSWEWDFGDGSTSTQQNPDHTYANSGTYTATLKVINDCSEDTKSLVLDINIIPRSVADFTYETIHNCDLAVIQFTDQSINADSWHWDFGDGHTSTEQNPRHEYYYDNTYNVTLTVTDMCGGDATTKSITIIIQHYPHAGFEAITDACIGNPVNFDDQSYYAETWEWDFGDGNISIEENPTHTFMVAGLYTVSLKIINDCGSDTYEQDILIHGNSTADFYADKTTVCVNESVEFIDNSDDSSFDSYSWLWDFGDGATSSSQFTSHQYSQAGSYTVSLTVKNLNGCGGDTETKELYITVLPASTSAFIATPDHGNEPLTVSFTNQSAHATNWEWDFGDGTTSTDWDPQHTYTNIGQFTVTLNTYNECGDDQSSEVITVTEPTCQADFGTEVTSGCGPFTAYFFDQSDCDVLAWSWTFGDGGTSIEQNPQHTYVNVGSYDVTLTITYDGGTDTETKTNYITVIAPPTSGFTANPTNGNAPLTVDFTDQSVGATSWSWDFDDGSPAVTDQNPTHIFVAGGTYTVTLTSTNECGSEESTEVITVTVPGLNADFSAEPLSGCDPLTVEFTDLSTGDVTYWLWEFGDGSTSTDQNPTHNYSVSGDYNITLNVIGPADTDVERKLYTFTIIDVPTADFSYVTNPSNNYAPVFTDFTDMSSGATSWYWDFGDGSAAVTDQNPQHIYIDSGHFTVTLTVSNGCGSDTKTAEIVVQRFFAPGALRLFTAVDKAQAPPEDTLLYTVTIRNTEHGPITDIIVHDTIPELTAYISGSAQSAVSSMPKLSNSGMAQTTSAFVYNPTDNMIIWSVDTVNALDSVKMQFRVVIDQSAPDGYIIPNKAIITNPPDQYAESEVTTLVTAPDIGIQKSANPVIANAGDTITYTIRVTNAGNFGLTDAILVDDHPDDFNFIYGSAMMDGVAINSSGSDPIRFELGDIGFPDTLVLTYLSEVPHGIDYSQPFVNTAILYDRGGDGLSRSWGPVIAVVGVDVPPLVITKRASVNSGFPGDIFDYTIVVENVSNTIANNSYVLDTLPFGFEYVDSTTLIDQNIAPDPSGINPLIWQLGDLDPGDKVTLRYTVQLSTRIMGGINENIAWAYADDFIPSRATCRVNVIPSTLSGSIRGRVIVDCNEGNELEFDTTLIGTDIFLDDGSHSQVNNKGMFYFNTVRSGQRAVMIDTRDLKEKLFDLSDDQTASVFVFVHEAGESYVIFKVCPSQPMLNLNKKAAQVPTATIIKSASIDTTKTYDSSGVVVDYEIRVDYSGGGNTANLKIVDSLPEFTQLSKSDSEDLVVSSNGKHLYNEFRVGADGFEKSIKYSLEDLDPGSRKFLENSIYLEGRPDSTAKEYSSKSTTATVAVGPLLTSPDADIKMNIIGAYFETSKAYLRPEAIPILEAIADSIQKYSDVTVKAEGHCDYRRIHTIKFPSNWELSEARALSVLNWLIENHNIDSSIMSYEGFAATKPVDTGHSEVHWQQNRRVEVFIKGRNRSQVDYSLIPVNNWEATTILELEPVIWDTVLVQEADSKTQTGHNLWEVHIVIENVGYYPAEDVVLDDILPQNSEYVKESASVDGKAVQATVDADGHLKIKLNRVDRKQKIEVRYRFKAKMETNPTGSSEAIIELEGRGKTVTHRSNAVRFE